MIKHNIFELYIPKNLEQFNYKFSTFEDVYNFFNNVSVDGKKLEVSEYENGIFVELPKRPHFIYFGFRDDNFNNGEMCINHHRKFGYGDLQENDIFIWVFPLNKMKLELKDFTKELKYDTQFDSMKGQKCILKKKYKKI